MTFEQLIDQWDPRLRKAFLESIANLRDAAQIEQIVRMLETGDIDGAIRAVGLNPVAFRPFDRAITQAFEAAGSATEAIVPATIAADGLRAVFQFNIRNREAEDWLRDNSSTMVTQILDDQRTMIRNALTRGMAGGVNPRTVALDLVGRTVNGVRQGGLIGLTSSQEEWVSNYAAELASDTPTNSLVRLLRDKRFDSAVIRAERDGNPLAQSLIDKMVTAYKNRALRYRGETIARSEAIQSMHEAQAQAMRQAIAQGIVRADTVTYIWRTAHDARVRDSHQAMDGQTRKLGQPFVSGLGNLLEYPGDENAPPEDVINCRCWRETKIDFLAGIPPTNTPVSGADLLKVVSGIPRTDANLVAAELDKLPKSFLNRLKELGVKVVVARNSVTDYFKDLKGVYPRGWDHLATWDSVPGLYRTETKEVVAAIDDVTRQIGTKHGSANLVLHESLHAYDFSGGKEALVSTESDFVNARQRDLSEVKAIGGGYLVQEGAAGLQETFAETGAMFFANKWPTGKMPNLLAYWKKLAKL